jgi:membrane protein required for colicin V production
MRPFLQVTGEELMAVLPDDPEGLIRKLRKPKTGAAEDGGSETDPDAKPLPKTGSDKRI